jgi:5'(3')-deoxyribonucleotidase
MALGGCLKILLDMDGVLADFVGGICRAHDRSNPFDDPANRGRYEMTDIWGISATQFWKPADEEFWANLEPTPEASEVVRLAVETVGIDNVCILSSPRSDPHCIPGKIRWIKRHFPELDRRYLFGPRKEFCAGLGRTLIDDYDVNVTGFYNAGGRALLFPRPWNSLGATGMKPAEFLERMVTNLFLEPFEG